MDRQAKNLANFKIASSATTSRKPQTASLRKKKRSYYRRRKLIKSMSLNHDLHPTSNTANIDEHDN